MAVDAGSLSEALVSDSAPEVEASGSGEPRRGVLALLCLIEAAWIGALIYGIVQLVGFIQS